MVLSTNELVEIFEDAGFNPEEAEHLVSINLINFQSPDFNQELYLDFDRVRRTGSRTGTDYFRSILEARNVNENENDDEDDDRLFRIGAPFNGIEEIKEYEDEKIYIPSSYYCLIKCIEKFLNKEIGYRGATPHGDSLNKIRLFLKSKKISLKEIPSFFKVNKNKKVRHVEKGHTSINKVGAGILFLKVKRGTYHAVLVKKEKILQEDVKYIISKIEIEKNSNLTDEYMNIQLPKFKEPEKSFYAYDIETSVEIIHEKVKKYIKETVDEKGNIIKGHTIEINEERRKMNPEGLSFMKIKTGRPCKKKHVRLCTGELCILKMLEKLLQSEPKKKEFRIFAHNGGRFDHLFVKRLKNVEILTQIKSGGSIKRLDVRYKKRLFIFQDSLAFLQNSLKNCCSFFKTENKQEFDIVDKNHEWFVNNKEWLTYVAQDTFVLGQILNKFEMYLNDLGMSITTSVGVASVAWQLMTKSCFGLSRQCIAKNPSTQAFIKESCYGGRILHYKKYFKANETLINGKTSAGLISLDGNSLYPSAMFKGRYPTGEHKVLKNLSLEYFDKQFIKGERLCIAEVEIDTCNSRYPLLPYRTEKRAVVYKAGIIQGVYNSTDLQEAVNDGMKITKVIKGIYWVRSSRIFKHLVESLYNKRAQFKKEGNGMEYVFKILLNSMFGKFLEVIEGGYQFTKSKLKKQLNVVKSSKLLKNGQIEYDIGYENPSIRKPAQIASFILAYSRKLMNNLIRKVGPQHIFYSDTDSIYIPIEAIGDTHLHGDLCGFKNDYGNGVLIEEAYFLDTKRYYMRFNKAVDGNISKAKFNGLNFKQAKLFGDVFLPKEEKDEKTRDLYKWFYNNPNKTQDEKLYQEKWTRLTDGVYISNKEMKFQIDPSKRGQWIDNIQYPLDFNLNEKENLLGDETSWGRDVELNYTLGFFGLRCSLPIVCKEMKDNYLAVEEKQFGEYFKCSYMINPIDKKIYKREFIKKDGKEIILYFNTNEYGITTLEKDPPKDLLGLICNKLYDGTCPKIKIKEMNEIKKTIKSFYKKEDNKEKIELLNVARDNFEDCEYKNCGIENLK